MAQLHGKDCKVYKDGTEIGVGTTSLRTMTDVQPGTTTKNNQGWKRKITGLRDASGSLSAVWDTDEAPPDIDLEDGDEVTLKVEVTTGKFWEGPAVISDLNLDVNVENPQNWSANWEANGPWSYTG